MPTDLNPEIARLKILIEGVEFRIASHVGVSNSGRDTSCHIKIPYDPEFRVEYLYGSTVQIFYANKRVLEKFGYTNWPILFNGEVKGHSVHQTTHSNSIHLNCVSSSRHYDQTPLYFLDPQSENNIHDFQNRVIFTGNSRYNTQTGSGPVATKARFREIIQQRIEEADEEQRFMAITGVNSDIMRLAAGNASFAMMDARHKLNARFAAFFDPDVSKILKLDELNELFGDRGGQLPAYASVRTIQTLITDMMQYDWIHIGQPSLSRVTDDSLNDARLNVNKGPTVAGVAVTIDDLSYNPAILNQNDINLIRSAVVQLKQELLAKQSSTDEYIRIDLSVGGFDISAKPVLNPTTKVRDKSFLQQAINLIQEERVSIPDAFSMLLNKGVGFSNEEEPDTFDDIFNPEETVRILRKERERTGLLLNEYISVPNMDFAQPPRCNVLFPHNMNQNGFTIDNYASITRLYGTARFLPNGPTEFYLAPTSTSFFRVENNRLAVWNDVYRARNRQTVKYKAIKANQQ